MLDNPAGHVSGAPNEAATLQRGDLNGGQEPGAALPGPIDGGSHPGLDSELDDFLANHLAPGTLKGYRGSFAKFSIFVQTRPNLFSDFHRQ